MNLFHKVLVTLLICFLFLLPVFADENDSKTSQHITLEIKSEGYELEVLINGFPYYSCIASNRVSKTARINGFLQESDNSIIAHLKELQEKDKNVTAYFSIAVISSFVNDKREILSEDAIVSLKYHPKNVEKGSGKQAEWQIIELPFVVKKFPVKILPWNEGEADYILDDSHKKELTKILLGFHDALASKDINVISDLMRVKNTHNAKALDMSLEKTEEMQNRFFEELFKDEQYHVEPMEKVELNFNKYDNVNLVKITSQDKPPVSARLSDHRYELQPYFSLIDGRWELVY